MTSGLEKLEGDKEQGHHPTRPQKLEMNDHIREARAKKDNSMAVGMNLVKTGQADAFVTAGNTGMAMYFGIKTFGMIPGVDRPCLAAVFPVQGWQVCHRGHWRQRGMQTGIFGAVRPDVQRLFTPDAGSGEPEDWSDCQWRRRRQRQ